LQGGLMEKEVKPRTWELPKKKKLCIVGCADSKDETPFANKDEFEFWGVNNLFLTMPGAWTRWFELHSITFDGQRWLRRGKAAFRGQSIDSYVEGLQKLDIPIYMQAPCEAISNAVIYPIQEVLERFGNYFTNTISYMICLGIMEGFEEIWIVGVDMAVDSEYHHQRPSCEYFIGVARGLGIKVYLSESCDLLKTRFLYALNEPQETAFDKKLTKMVGSMQMRMQKSINEYEMHKKKADQYIGAMSAVNEVKKAWSNTVQLWPGKGE